MSASLTKWLRISLVSLPALYTIYTVIRWRLLAAKERRILERLCPTLPVITINFNRTMFGIIDVTNFSIIPTWWMPKILPKGWQWMGGHDVYEQLGEDTIAIVSPGDRQFWVVDADLVKDIVSRKSDFVKPVHIYTILNIFGSNVVTTEHAEWRRHRRIVSPQFSERINLSVLQYAAETVRDMLKCWQSTEHTAHGEVRVNVSNDMMKLALHVISGAGFGMRLDWVTSESDQTLDHGHTMSYKTAVHSMMAGLPLKIILPKFAYLLPIERVQNVKRSFDEFGLYLSEVIRGADKQDESNLLVSLAKAARAEDGGLTEQELVGNVFVFLFAGHETTASTFMFALAMLASHQDVQQRLYEEIQLILDGNDPQLKDIQNLGYTLAVMNETLRMFPPVVAIPKHTTSQQTLGKYIIPEDTRVTLHTVGIHYNPKYWGPDPNVFRPARWFTLPECASSAVKTRDFIRSTTQLKSQTSPSEPEHDKTRSDVPDTASDKPHQSLFSYNRYAFLPYSEGMRSCLGKRFAQVEFITGLAMMMQKYSVHLPDGAQIEEVIESQNRVTLQPKRDMYLVFKPRTST
ncbi:hypothetical protein MT418_002270 [Batrachochytrium dendrobatidis]